jgi:hypothetical protein
MRVSRRAAIVTQADVRRVTRGAMQAGAAEVEVRPDGRMIVRFAPSTPLAPVKEIVL